MKDATTRRAQSERIEALRDLALFPLDDQVVVFCEETQCLIGVDLAAAALLRNLRQGLGGEELVRAIASEGLVPPDEIAPWLNSTLDAFRLNGLFAGSPQPKPRFLVASDEQVRAGLRVDLVRPFAPFEPFAERRYRALDTCAVLRFSHEDQIRLVESVVGHLATDDDDKPTVVIDIRGQTIAPHLHSDVYRDGEPFGCAPRLSRLGPVVKGALWQAAINATDFLYYFHAGVVGTGSNCVLLPATSGSGKSSLTGALAHAGFHYYSDEVALILRGSFKVPPTPFGLCIKEQGWDLMARYYPNIAGLPVHRREDDRTVRYILPANGAARRPALAVSHIIFPRFEPHAETILRPLGHPEALGRLMGECFALRGRLDQQGVSELVRWLSGTTCYALIFSSLDEAVSEVRNVIPLPA